MALGRMVQEASPVSTFVSLINIAVSQHTTKHTVNHSLWNALLVCDRISWESPTIFYKPLRSCYHNSCIAPAHIISYNFVSKSRSLYRDILVTWKKRLKRYWDICLVYAHIFSAFQPSYEHSLCVPQVKKKAIVNRVIWEEIWRWIMQQ
jgi:hypothetical protein